MSADDTPANGSTPDSAARGADPRPRPAYGEYATPEEVAALRGTQDEVEKAARLESPNAPAPLPAPTSSSSGPSPRPSDRIDDPVSDAPAAAARPGKNRTAQDRPAQDRTGVASARGRGGWDRPITIALLVFAGAQLLISSGPSFLSFGASMSQSMQMLGVEGFTSSGAAQSAGFWLLIVHGVLLIATVVLSVARLHAGRRAFWIPLVGGAVAGIVTLSVVMTIMLNDPGVAAYIQQQSGG
ncbi:MAG: DUF6264 family protein [Microbacteriaceae bacterium]